MKQADEAPTESGRLKQQTASQPAEKTQKVVRKKTWSRTHNLGRCCGINSPTSD
ncbi:MAG: hypothetical protein RLZZ230_179 [Candidatus Parcubacteria bacterium]|jgi:hypothetical protein